MKPFHDPKLRNSAAGTQAAERADHRPVSKDELITAGYSQAARDQAETIENFRRFIEEHKDELIALQVFYGQATPTDSVPRPEGARRA